MPSKAEKRRALKELEQKKFEEKKAAHIQKLLGTKRPEEALHPEIKKVPIAGKPGSRMQQRMLYGKTKEDRVGAWTWGQAREWHPDPGDDCIYGYLDAYKVKTWAEIERETTRGKRGKRTPRNKAYDTSEICKEAWNRVVELKLDDNPRIFRFRMTGKRRLYGFIYGDTFEIVWFDAEHMIYQD